jgi:hypothetical protein
MIANGIYACIIYKFNQQCVSYLLIKKKGGQNEKVTTIFPTQFSV